MSPYSTRNSQWSLRLITSSSVQIVCGYKYDIIDVKACNNNSVDCAKPNHDAVLVVFRK